VADNVYPRIRAKVEGGRQGLTLTVWYLHAALPTVPRLLIDMTARSPEDAEAIVRTIAQRQGVPTDHIDLATVTPHGGDKWITFNEN